MKHKTSIAKKNTKYNSKSLNRRKTLKNSYRKFRKRGGDVNNTFDFNIDEKDIAKYGILYYKQNDREVINKLKPSEIDITKIKNITDEPIQNTESVSSNSKPVDLNIKIDETVKSELEDYFKNMNL